MTEAPRILDYSDYRRYLRDFYSFKKSQNKLFSFRRFAELAGLKSSNYLMLVMDGKRNLSFEKARDVSRAMRLNGGESEIFVSLVKLEQTTSDTERVKIERERKVALRKLVTREIPLEKAEYLRAWHHAAIRELAFLKDFEPRAKWVCQKLKGLVTFEQAEHSIALLYRLKLWELQAGVVVVRDLVIDTGAEERAFADVSVANVHKQNLMAWTKHLEDWPKERRELGLLNIPMAADKVPELKRRIREFQDEIIGWLQNETEADILVQLGTYLAPLTE